MLQVQISGNRVTIWRERPATQEEKEADKEARVMSEVVSIYFGEDEPKLTINRDLCGA
jgi:hypothetical protein